MNTDVLKSRKNFGYRELELFGNISFNSESIEIWFDKSLDPILQYIFGFREFSVKARELKFNRNIACNSHPTFT